MDLEFDETEPEAETLARKIEGDILPAENVRDIMRQVPEARNVILAAVFRALGAKRRLYVKGSPSPVYEIDYRSQLEAAKLLLAYGDGLPMQTTLAVNVGDGNAAGSTSLEEAVERSPALKSRLAKMLGAPQRLTKAA
jgi:hypothetical protein